MDKQNRDIKTVCNSFQGSQNIVVCAIIVSFHTIVTDLLKCINDDQFHTWMILDKVGELLFQTGTQSFRIHSKMNAAGLSSADVHQPLLHPAVRVLQAEVENRTLVGFKFPHRLTGADAMSQPQHQPGLTDLRRTGEDVQALAHQTVDQIQIRWEMFVHQLVGGDGIQVTNLDSQHPAHMLQRITAGFEKVPFLGVIHYIALASAFVAAPHEVTDDSGLPAAMGAGRE